MRDCGVWDLSPFTIEYYRVQLAAFETFARAQNVIQVPEITADLLRAPNEDSVFDGSEVIEPALVKEQPTKDNQDAQQEIKESEEKRQKAIEEGEQRD